ncbi:hypothetical protein KUTeg_007899 [Tegillarca granosa]|uniref:Nucleolar pre-ribosomal-associated protein 1 n=1 Tax=Tegillarca granosa TaxID=220873 RepID=A0ABQ9FEN8_TEGGR|nr:hypothetical protein KUTeg_007899 [Tegillarca granosa]
MDGTITARKKRKKASSQVQDEDIPQDKKPKNEEFTEINFKHSIKNPDYTFTALEMFVDTAQKWSPDSGYDIVNAYCRTSGECEEIFKVLEAGRRKHQEIALVFGALEAILIRIIDDLEKYTFIGQNIVQKVVSSRMGTVYFSLQPSNKSNNIKMTLKMLTAMVMVSEATAKALIGQFDFNNVNIQPLFNRRNTRDPKDVRTCMLHFIMSFLMTGGDFVIKQLVEERGILGRVFNGMKFDNVTTIELVLSTVLEKIVQNPAISKTSKMKIFGEATLKHLIHLYNWKGPSSWKNQMETGTEEANILSTESDKNEDQQRVSESVHSLLTENQNMLITNFLASVGSLENPLIKDLVIKTLATCPDQLGWYLKTLLNSLTPRSSNKWGMTMDLLCKIYENLSVLPSVKEHLSTEKFVQMVLVFVLPPQQVTNTVMQAIKVMPDMKTLMTCLDKTTKKSDEVKADIEMEDGLHTEMMTVSKIDHIILLEQVLCLFQELSPLVLVDNPADINRLMEVVKHVTHNKDQSENMKDSEENNQVTHDIDGTNQNEVLPNLYLLKLLSGTDARKLPWEKSGSEGHTLMYLLLEMLLKINDKPLLNITQYLICQLLVSTGLFEGTKEEIHFWLKHYCSFVRGDNCDKQKLTEILSVIFITYISNPYPYIDKVSDCMSEAAAMETAESKMEATSIGTSDSFIDAVLEMDDEEMEDQLIVQDSGISTHQQLKLPFSPLTVVALEHLSKSDSQIAGFPEYLSCTVLDIFHIQMDPFPYICLVNKSSNDLDTKVKKYMLSWLPTDKEKKLKLPSETSVLTHLDEYSLNLLKIFIDSDISLAEDVCDQRLMSKDAEIIIKHCLLYIQAIIKKCEQGKTLKTDLIEVFYGIIRNAFGSLKCEQLDNSEDVETQSPELAILFNMKDQPTDKILHCVEYFLCHPVNKCWFLCMKESKDINNDLKEEISDCVTSQVTMTISEFEDVKLEKAIEPYFGNLCSYLQGMKEERCSDHEKLTTIKRITDIICKHVNKDCQENLLCILVDTPLNVLRKKKSKELSPLAKVLILLIQNLTTSDTVLKISVNTVHKLFDLLVELGNEKLDSALEQFFTTFAYFTVMVKQKTFEYLLSKPNNAKLEMAVVIITHNSLMRGYFGKWIAENLTDCNKREYLTVIITYLTCLIETSEFQEIHTDQDTTHLKCTLLEKLMKLKCYGKKYLKKIVQNIIAAIDKNVHVTSHHIDVLHGILTDLNKSEEETTECCGSRKTLFISCKTCMMKSMSSKQNRNRKLEEHCIKIIVGFQQKELVELVVDKNVEDWSSFMKSILKNYYRDPGVLSLLEKLVRALYTNGVEQKQDLPAELLFEMVTGHSLYLQIMFNEAYPCAKEPLIDLLTALVEVKPDCCVTKHVGILLGAYGATLSQSDQKILYLLQIFEKNGAIMSEFKPFLWGAKAVEQQSIKNSLGPSLWKQPTLENVMENLDPAKLHYSILNFPLRRKLMPLMVQTITDCKSEDDVYDPCFILPLFSYLMSPDSLLDCRRVVESNCLGYIMAAISSHDTAMRGATYHVLGEYMQHLEGARFPEKDQVLYLLQLLQRSIEKPNIKIASIIMIFFAKAVKILLAPGDHMYPVINSFLLLKPNLDILNFKEERGWILGLLSEGLRETADYRIYQKRYIFKLLLGYYDSSISDSYTQNQVLKIVCAACREKTAALDLVKHHGIISWLSGVLTYREDTSHEVWISFLKTLLSVLKHINTTVESLKVQGHSYHHVALNLRDVCMLTSLTSGKERESIETAHRIMESCGFMIHRGEDVKVKQNIDHSTKKKEGQKIESSNSKNDFSSGQVEHATEQANFEKSTKQIQILAMSVCQYWCPWQPDIDSQAAHENDALICSRVPVYLVLDVSSVSDCQ